jgi:hypothetical protein
MRHDAREMMMQGATLIVGIGGAMVVVPAPLVCMMMMSVIGRVGTGSVIRNVLFACRDMLEMDDDQRHDTGELGNQEKPQNPPAKSALDVQRSHLIDLVTW